MLWVIDLMVLRISKLFGWRISRERAYRMLQRWIQDQIRDDPEAVIPRRGVGAVYAFEHAIYKDIPDEGLVMELFGIQHSPRRVLRPYGVAPHALEIGMTSQARCLTLQAAS
jgi:hypothetical protein